MKKSELKKLIRECINENMHQEHLQEMLLDFSRQLFIELHITDPRAYKVAQRLVKEFSPKYIGKV